MNTVEALTSAEEVEQVVSLLKKHYTPIYADIFKFGINAALRISDMLLITYDDVKANQLTLKESKTGKTRVITLNSAAKQIIIERKSLYPKHTYLFEVDSNRAKGKPISRYTVAKVFKDVGEIVGKKLSTHSMRKTRGAIMYNQGVKIEKICMMLGHSSPAVTLRYIGITAKEVEDSYHEFVL